jgi:hypothetical protein
MVDESTLNTADYVTSPTPDAKDTYTFQALPALADKSVHGVAVDAYALLDVSGSRSIGSVAISGASEVAIGSTSLTTTGIYSQWIHDNNPDGSPTTQWDEDSVNAAEFGIKITI